MKSAEHRKDRSYGGKNSGKAPPDKGSSKCFDCGEVGHWAGDSSCKKPGAALLKSKYPPSSKGGKGKGGGKSRGNKPGEVSDLARR